VRFGSVDEVERALRAESYLADRGLATSIFLSLAMGRALLLEGEAGVGKTEVAKALAGASGARLIRLQCHEGIDIHHALYDWDYPRQLLHLRAGADDPLYSERFLLRRPLLEALQASEPVVLLIDEIDRADDEFEAFLLEFLSDFQVSIPELGTITGNQRPLVFLTSNNTRELSEALKRRCLYLHIDYPDLDREKEIVLAKVPGVSDNLADQIARIVRSIRQLELKKAPSVSETIDWARTLVLLGIDHIDAQQAKETLHILLKYQSDIAKAAKELAVEAK
jgi:MoxR-like ATPase